MKNNHEVRLFCIHPFNGITVSRTGDVYMCCADWLPAPLGSLLTTPLMDIWQGEMATKIRISILDQSFRFCKSTCPYLSPPRGPVVSGLRLQSSPNLNRIKELKLSYDPTCNLRCPSCRTAAVGPSEMTGQIHSKVLGSLQHVDRLYLSGYGDPVASPYYWSLLCSLGLLPVSQNLTVHLHTNGLLLTPRKWEELGENSRRVVAITVSVDAACRDTYKLNRGGDWEQLQENLGFISRLSGVRLQMNFVVQANNFGEMAEFAHLAFRHSAKLVFFAGMRNWDAVLPSSDHNLHPIFTGLEYQQRAVHLPAHPQHGRLLEMLQDPVFSDPRVVLGDFLLSSALQDSGGSFA